MPPAPRTIHHAAAPNASNGSMTLTTAQTGPSVPFHLPSGTLRLRAASDAEPATPEPTERRRIQWAEDVIDNEGMGKKSSKVCCIYHKPREAGESSSDSSDSSDSSSDSDSEPDTSRARPTNHRSRRQHNHRHDDGDGGEECNHDHDHDHDPSHGQPRSNREGKQRERRRSPNAYERVPKRKTPKPSK
ncbi:hypothetical protein AAFC00_003584 [Neodothiora populina]|uniref:Type 1 phosphatases regulator n=1 Tax=Neodothiora populina TaxID=2781224 RepID=A0ABR3PEP0_9PEZI